MKMQVSFEIIISMVIGLLFISSMLYMYLQVDAAISNYQNSLSLGHLQLVFNSIFGFDKYAVAKMHYSQ